MLLKNLKLAHLKKIILVSLTICPVTIKEKVRLYMKKNNKSSLPINLSTINNIILRLTKNQHPVI